jgi:SAM-dependent methyltransferase
MGVLPRRIDDIGQTAILGRYNLKPPANSSEHAKFLRNSALQTILSRRGQKDMDFFPDADSDQYAHTNLRAYFGLISSRNQENQNENRSSPKYRIYKARLNKLIKYASGITLDVGADNCHELIKILPNGVEYIGLTPDESIHEENGHHGLLRGLGEFLPFKNETLDTVMFNTSLDHILDANLAVSEAYRVLKKGGRLIICSLVWLENFELWRDDVHFHHFRPFEIEGFLENFEIEYLETYKYGEDTHRYGAFLSAMKLT